MERWSNVNGCQFQQPDVDKRTSPPPPSDSQPTSAPSTAPSRHRTRNRRRTRKTGSQRLSAATNVDQDECRRKLFVGQLPSHVSEQQLRLVFNKFGRIVQLKVKRDPATGNSYGLVTYVTNVSALEARKTLHNRLQLPGTRRPLQVKFVDHLANYRQRKVFVGRIARHLTEADLISLFASFGDVEDCAIVRRPSSGLSAGCAFVTFADRTSAAAAICCLRRSQVMTGGMSSMVVKLADSPETKLLKRREELVRRQSTSTSTLHGRVHSIHTVY